MVHVGRHARRWSAYVAIGVVALAIGGLASKQPAEQRQVVQTKASTSKQGTAQPAPPVKPVASKPQGEHGGQATAQASQGANRWTEPLTLFTGLLVIVGAVQAWIVFRALVDSRIALIATQRAFVFVKTQKFEPVGNDFIFLVEWENSGTTPTRRCLTHNSWKYFPKRVPPKYQFPDLGANGKPVKKPERIPTFIGPKGITLGGMNVVGSHFVNQVVQGKGELLAWGWIDYDDVFGGRRHRTEYCLIAQVKAAETIASPDGQVHIAATITFKNYRVHNGAEDECMKKPSPYYPERKLPWRDFIREFAKAMSE